MKSMMQRERLAWCAAVIALGMLGLSLPGSMAQRDDEYAFVRTLIDIHRQVGANYVDEIDPQTLRNGAIEGMLQQLDPFSVYVPPAMQETFDRMLEGTFKGVGIQLNQLDNGAVEVVTPVDGSPAALAGVMAGDIVLRVNGESIEGLRLPEVIRRISGPLGSDVTLTVRHLTGETRDLSMTRQEIVVPTIKGYARRDDNSWDYLVLQEPRIGYLRITQFTPETADSFAAAVESLRAEPLAGLILDLRYNPGGRLDQAVRMLDMMVPEGVLITTRGRSTPEQAVRASGDARFTDFPIAVLVNEHSASASEVLAGSLKDNRRALVIGSRTYGKGSVQNVVPLDGEGGELKLTVAYYYLPGGRLVHRRKDATDWGVEPNIPIEMSLEEQQEVWLARSQSENFRRPTTRPATQPSTESAAEQGPVDLHVQRAVDTLVALAFLKSAPENAGPTPAVTTAAAPSVETGPGDAAPPAPAPSAPTVAPGTAPAATAPAGDEP